LSAHAWARLRDRNGIGDRSATPGAFDSGLSAATSKAGHGQHKTALVRPPHGPVGRADPWLVFGMTRWPREVISGAFGEQGIGPRGCGIVVGPDFRDSFCRIS